ncbi:Imm39 family immunity protein [Sphingomonas sp. NIBR02145]|uniref:Imm39 family immunity protein n=1 Tax=Sphingomonas sp. NIBR02145 TaxID=3014784 RepID=UPI00339029E7
MAHNRKLVIGCVALTMARVRPTKAVASAGNRVREELEQEIIQSEYLENTPFRWVGLIIREGLVDEEKPHFGRIDPKDGELPLAIEIDVHRLLGATEDEMARVYRKATLTALVHAGKKYNFPIDRFKELLDAT